MTSSSPTSHRPAPDVIVARCGVDTPVIVARVGSIRRRYRGHVPDQVAPFPADRPVMAAASSDRAVPA